MAGELADGFVSAQMGPDQRTMRRRLRVGQIKVAAKLIRVASASGVGEAAVRSVRRTRFGRAAMDAVLGYHRVFPTLIEAEIAVLPYANGGHQNSANAQMHLDLNVTPRPSDYAALFHLAPRMRGAKLVFDLGGNVGNLYYCYEGYLRFDEDCVWNVYDLPANLEFGSKLAAERDARHLRFTERWSDASGADVLIVSGSLHYFRPLAHLVEGLERRPRAILINRAPLTRGPSVAVVQDAGAFRVACMLYNRDELVAGLEGLGYALVDDWRAVELSLAVPGDPDHRVDAYSGLFFELRPPRAPASPGEADAADARSSEGGGPADG